MCCVVHRKAGVSVGWGVSGHVMLGLLGGTARTGVGVGWGSQNCLGRLVGSGAGQEGPRVIPEMPWWGWDKHGLGILYHAVPVPPWKDGWFSCRPGGSGMYCARASLAGWLELEHAMAVGVLRHAALGLPW